MRGGKIAGGLTTTPQKLAISMRRTKPLRRGGIRLYSRPIWRLRFRGNRRLIRADLSGQRLIGDTYTGEKGNRSLRYIGYDNVALWRFVRGAIREPYRISRRSLGSSPVSQTPAEIIVNISGKRASKIRPLRTHPLREARSRQRGPTMKIYATRANQATQLKKFLRNLRRNIQWTFEVS